MASGDMTSSKENAIFPPGEAVHKAAYVSSMEQYHKMYKESVTDPEAFWMKIAKDFYFKEQHSGKFFDYNFNINKGPIYVKCMENASTNICYNCLDRHVKNGQGDVTAFYWEGNDPMDCTNITYKKLLDEVCKFSNVLKSLGVKKGDRVAIYMPMIIELVIAMLACARIGAIHSIVFAGFSAESLSSRILDAECDILLTADGVYRGSKLIHLKQIADEAINLCKDKHKVSTCITVRHLTDNSFSDDVSDRPGKRPCSKVQVPWNSGVDKWWHILMEGASTECEPEWLKSEEPLFILYTSGSTGKPKGILHHVTGYMLYAATTHKYTFDYHAGDIYFCTADIGWITGHTYITYGPLLNGATSVLFEGIPLFPDPSRYWSIVDKYQVSKFYTAPTAVRSLMKFGDDPVKKYKRSSLQVLGTVGEPINPEAWMWYHKVIGNSNCTIVDTFWQTETGGHVLTPLPGCTPTKPGSATFPFFGIVPAVLSENGEEVEGPGDGYLVFKQPWPGMMRTIYGDQKRFEGTYFKRFPGYYVPGDGCYRDDDGYYWITGRIDDMINVSGHLLSTAEVESVLIEHPSVAEAAVVGKPHSIKGEALYCFVTLVDGIEFTPELVKELKERVRHSIGPFCTPDYVQYAPGLPKTRSGKIMRRVLRNVARGNHDIGDVSTMADQSVVDVLFTNRPEQD
uniref:Acetyl-coenzyme A synthetase n=1 Tax=Phallusia mammillata TaxID=59560 RepID=A0A6F9D570_9ASCI|nr:acetyl-coenzyme A synthetase, cytoplasmic [Phallusia mammillata]